MQSSLLSETVSLSDLIEIVHCNKCFIAGVYIVVLSEYSLCRKIFVDAFREIFPLVQRKTNFSSPILEFRKAVYSSSGNPCGPVFSCSSFFSPREIFLTVKNSLQYDVIIKTYKQFIE